MYDTRGKALDRICTLGLPPVFAQIWDGNGPSGFQGQGPCFFFEVRPALVQICPRIGRILPILEVNGERILGFDEESGEFLDYYYYDADAKVIGTSYQQFISAVFADLGFAGLVDRVRVAAKDFEYKYLDIFLAWMEEDDDLSAADAKRVLIQRVAELEASRTSDTGVQAPSALQPKKETH